MNELGRDGSTLHWIAPLCALCVLVACSGGEPSVEEARRDLLKPADREQAIAELREKRRLYDDKGGLLPSDTEAMGIRLPRGLTPRKDLEYFKDYETRVRYDALERYFRSRLFTGQIEKLASGAVRFVDAVPVDRRDAPPVEVTVGRIGPRTGYSFVRLRRQEPRMTKILSPAEAEAYVKERRARAE